ncbi:hypothetical protein OAK24_01815 [Flavobacteriales bacterium]|nr:hypothetical protein [Flavobacteriales bacterium]
MKRITLIMLVAMVPFLTMAQKRSKKNKNTKIEKVVDSGAAYEFLVIRAIEYNERVISGSDLEDMESEDLIRLKLNNLIDVTYMVTYNFGTTTIQENDSDLMRSSTKLRSMSEAVNAAANNGWEFQNANVVVVGENRVHYYYMKRDK